jgi:iron complex transport system substrate-binding protein
MQNNKNLLLSMLLLVVFLLAACSPAPLTAPETAPAPAPTEVPAQPAGLEFTDGLGRAVHLAGPAQRIASMAPSNTEFLFAVGAGAQVVGRDEFSDYPAGVADLPSIGGSFGDYNYEAIVDLNPDLVLASELNTPEQVRALEDLGLTVYYLQNPVTLEDLYANLERVGALTGHEAETAVLIGGLKARVAAVEEALAGVEAEPLVFYEIDSTDPAAPYTSGAGTFSDTMLNMVKARNLGASLQGAYAQISLEELLVQDPDFILLGDAVWGGITPEMVAQRAGWDQLTAVKEGRVLPFDDNLISRPGPRQVDGLEALARVLHPERFE